MSDANSVNAGPATTPATAAERVHRLSGRAMRRPRALLLDFGGVLVETSRRPGWSAALAKEISAASRVPVAHETLRRVKATAQQVGLSRTQRAENVQGAFHVPVEQRAAVKGRRLVLVDDVLTSGATLDACARALLRAGAKQVDALVFARVVDAAKAPI